MFNQAYNEFWYNGGYVEGAASVSAEATASAKPTRVVSGVGEAKVAALASSKAIAIMVGKGHAIAETTAQALGIRPIVVEPEPVSAYAFADARSVIIAIGSSQQKARAFVTAIPRLVRWKEGYEPLTIWVATDEPDSIWTPIQYEETVWR